MSGLTTRVEAGSGGVDALPVALGVGVDVGGGLDVMVEVGGAQPFALVAHGISGFLERSTGPAEGIDARRITRIVLPRDAAVGQMLECLFERVVEC